ncbi:MAG: DNA (cytosine-5-)-methyltransferase [Bacteroidetes bacterium]|nr:DNA (cytosine-5-)-methyltransferase [Bacteroidota bacterium]MBK9047880.1 DNA (cytosine-5-)-methyltransferase [Bacteroidota bacterium]
MKRKKSKPTYSEIKKVLKLGDSKNFEEGLDSFTHYLQNSENGVSKCFKKTATAFLAERIEQYSLTEKADFQYFLPLKWDVPFPPPEKPKFTFIDLFAGIGGFRLAFQSKGGKCIFTSEWDKNSQKTYEANFGEVPFGDITQIDEEQIPDHDILLGGFPCQPFSIAGVSKKNSLGKKHGFADETQGTLFYDIVRIINEKKPKAFLLENVKNLTSHDKGRTFKIISETLKKLGYIVFSKVLDAKHYVPQHRERIFIAGFSKEHFPESVNFKFPEPPEQELRIAEILQPGTDTKYTLTDNLWTYLKKYAQKHKEKGNGFGFGLVDLNGVSRTLSARYYKDGSEILIPQGKGKNPRRLTPEECRALMGYPDKFIIRNIGVSDTQLYRQFGNSVAVPVVTAIAKSMMEFISRNEIKSKIGKKEKPVLVG